MTVLTMAMTPARAADVCDPATRARLEALFDVRWGSPSFGPEELATPGPRQRGAGDLLGDPAPGAGTVLRRAAPPL